MTIKKNEHTWLFYYISECHPYDEVTLAKEFLVSDYTQGKTSSLSLMLKKYPRDYYRMKKELLEKMKEYNTRMQKQRRKLLRLIYQFAERNQYQYSKENVMEIACKACHVKFLNDATERNLIAAIKSFDDQDRTKQVKELMESIKQ